MSAPHVVTLVIDMPITKLDALDTIAFLADGEVVEQGETAALLDAPQHPYTQRLRAAVPELH